MKKKTTEPARGIKVPLSLIILGLSCLVILGVWIALKILSSQSFVTVISPKHNSAKVSGQMILSSNKEPLATTSAKPHQAVGYIPQFSGYQLRVPILMYHYIGNNPNPKDLARNSLSVNPDKFGEQMKYLHDNGYTSVSLDTLYAALHKQAALPSKPVVLTFDDGYEDFYYNAYPILLRFGLHATEFIPTGLMNQGYYLNWDQIRQMSASGLITFGAHTVHHYNLPSYPKETIAFELAESKKALQGQLNVPINFMAYPNGATNSEVIELTKKAGYIGATGTWANKIQSEGTIYNMPRIRVSGSIDINTFAGLL